METIETAVSIMDNLETPLFQEFGDNLVLNEMPQLEVVSAYHTQ